ncbi:MAG: hypothetical protein ABSD08_08460 [Xanthobacteraceae bacterium]
MAAFKRFATHSGGTQSAKHIKPIHWYIACRLVLEGGFNPHHITPRPPFVFAELRTKRGIERTISYEPTAARGGEQIILGGLKTKNVDVVVTNPELGPVLAVSCKGVTKAFRNLTNRMEETIGECTNLHITYPALVLGYFSVVRANRTLKDAIEAPANDAEEADSEIGPDSSAISTSAPIEDRPSTIADRIKANDIAILEDGSISDGLIRFHAALSEMTGRRGVRNEISRYEAMALTLIEPKGDQPGSIFPNFPPVESSLHLSRFFSTLYQRYEERFVFGAPLLADRGITTRFEWSPDSVLFTRSALDASNWPALDFEPRLSAFS